MCCSSPPLRAGSRPDRARRAVTRWTAVAALALGMAVSVTACHAAVPPPDSDDTAGPEWRTDVRRSPGAATRVSPAVLTGVSVEPHNAYDRVVFAFDGDRPGYRVAYEDRADGPVLRVTINHVQEPTEQRLSPQAEVVAEVIRHPSDDLVIDAVIELADGTTDTRPPFRVGLDVGEFYVDVGHP
jgi:hypothetical protein